MCVSLIFDVCACVADLVQNPLHPKRSSMCPTSYHMSTIRVTKVHLKPDHTSDYRLKLHSLI